MIRAYTGRQNIMMCPCLRSLQEVVQMNRKGFTLIELLIVVVIIGILAAIAIPKFANTKAKAYVASMKSDLRNLVTAEEAYFADSVKYSATVACTTPPTAGAVNFCVTTGNNLGTIGQIGRAACRERAMISVIRLSPSFMCGILLMCAALSPSSTRRARFSGFRRELTFG